jgi:hypothetical protein
MRASTLDADIHFRSRAAGVCRIMFVAFSLALPVICTDPAPARAQRKAPPVPVQPVNRWPDEQFERWVFNQYGGTADAARRRFETLLMQNIDNIDRACQLSDEQKKKLQLTGRGDIKRIFEGYEQAKHRFNLLDNDVQKLNEVQQDIRLFQAAGGPFESDSLFTKSLRHSLNNEQFARFDAANRERQAFRHRAHVELAVHNLEQTLPLRDAQRQDFVDLLMKETKPTRASGYYDFYLIMYQLDHIPEEKVKPLFSAVQWKALQRQVAEYKGIIPNLRQNGVLKEIDDDADAAVAPAKK